MTELRTIKQASRRYRAACKQPVLKTWEKQQLTPRRSLPQTSPLLSLSGKRRKHGYASFPKPTKGAPGKRRCPRRTLGADQTLCPTRVRFPRWTPSAPGTGRSPTRRRVGATPPSAGQRRSGTAPPPRCGPHIHSWRRAHRQDGGGRAASLVFPLSGREGTSLLQPARCAVKGRSWETSLPSRHRTWKISASQQARSLLTCWQQPSSDLTFLEPS